MELDDYFFPFSLADIIGISAIVWFQDCWSISDSNDYRINMNYNIIYSLYSILNRGQRCLYTMCFSIMFCYSTLCCNLLNIKQHSCDSWSAWHLGKSKPRYQLKQLRHRMRKCLRSLLWRHNGGECVSNHQLRNCLLNRIFGRRSEKTLKLRVTGLCAGNSPETGEFPAQMASNAENVSIWWRHHVMQEKYRNSSDSKHCKIHPIK